MTGEQIDILESYLLDAVHQTLPQCTWTGLEQGFVVPSNLRQGVLGFVSPQLKGTLSLRVSDAILQLTCPGIQDAGEQLALFLDDWVAELNNLLLGRLKGRLLAHGIDLKLLTLPPPELAAWFARDSELVYWEKTSGLRHADNFLVLDYRVHFDPTLDLSCAAPVLVNSLRPGDAVYRLTEAEGQSKRYDMVYKVRSGVEVEEEGEDELFSNEFSPVRSPYVPSGSPPALAALPKRQKLSSIEWQDETCLRLRFEGQLSYEISPNILLADGLRVEIELESYRIELSREPQGLLISIPELQIKLRKSC